MSKEIWINLPVKDLKRSKKFFDEIGFKTDKGSGNDEELIGITYGEGNVNIMLFPETVFRGYTDNEISNSKAGTEVLFSFGAESKEEVDEMMKLVMQAGGAVYGKPEGDGWMYGGGFIDLDGHRWNMLYMDFSKLQG